MSEVLNHAAAADLESPPCPLCRGLDYELVLRGAKDRLHGKPGLFNVQRCLGCGLLATWPRPSAQRLPFYYQNVYSGAAQAAARNWQTGWIGRWVAAYRLRMISRVIGIDGGTEVLDVGCGYGEFLRRARTRSGCKAFGLDMDASCAEQAQAHAGAPCAAGDLLSHDWGEQHFDLICFFESLEHHQDPIAALSVAHALLKPGGHCAIEVPDFGGFWRHVFGAYWMPLLAPQHLFHFTRQSLEQALRRAGFSVVRRRSMWFPLESTASLGLCLHALSQRMRPAGKFSWRGPRGILLALCMALWWPLIELPSQTILWLVGRTGHQWVLAKKIQATNGE